MKSLNSSYRACTALALALAATVAAAPARADLVLLGADYFATIQPTFFTPLGAANPLAGLPFGPGNTDTVVHRQRDCSLSLGTLGSNCTIGIELVALSLISTVNPLVRLRESPTLESTGEMTIISDGSGTGGTFNSFFDIFFELSFDGGSTFDPKGPLHLISDPRKIPHWTMIEPLPPFLFVDGLIGDRNANRHTNKNSRVCPEFGQGRCVDFFLVQDVNEIHPDGSVHSAIAAQIPEPSTVALLGLGLAAIAGLGRRARRMDVRGDKTPTDASGPA